MAECQLSQHIRFISLICLQKLCQQSDGNEPEPDIRFGYVQVMVFGVNDVDVSIANTFILRADSKTVISDSSSVGRNSVRIRTNNAYTTHVAV
jgi:hypothetical protein